MIMRRLTPEDAYRALKENKTVYSVTEIEMTQDPMEVLDQIFGANDLIIFDEIAEKEPDENTRKYSKVLETEPSDEGRTETTATEQGAPAEAVEKPKQAKRGRPRRMQ